MAALQEIGLSSKEIASHCRPEKIMNENLNR